jgi:hypothetical protein
MMATGLLDYLEAIGETGATLGSGAAATMAGIPYGILQNIRSGKYGTKEGVKLADKATQDFIKQYTYAPRGQMAQNAMQSVAGLLESTKLPPVLPEAGLLAAIPKGTYASQFERAGMAAERAMEPVAANVMARGGLPAQLLTDLTQGTRSQMLPGNNVFDPRFDPRVLEQERLKNLKTTIVPIQNYNVPEVSLANYEGYPFITSMADRTRTGLLTDIDGVLLNRPVELQGGQPYMFENPGQVWASGKKPATDIYELAAELKSATKKDPLFLPWVMSPSGSDFANMTGETMLAYAQSAMGKGTKSALDSRIKKQFIPDWKGIDDPASINQFKNLSDKKRKSMKKTLLDKEFRNEGGLSIGEARLAIADPAQLMTKDASILNVGQVFPDRPMIMQSGHSSYPLGVPGQGLGVSKDQFNIFQLLQDYSKSRGIKDPTNPSRPDIRTLEMKPYGGLLTADVLKSLGY